MYGEAQKDLETACRALNLPLHSFQWNESMIETGLKRDSLYLVRPDGYIAAASLEQDTSNLRTLLERFHLRFQT